jgi:hypothetical protein
LGEKILFSNFVAKDIFVTAQYPFLLTIIKLCLENVTDRIYFEHTINTVQKYRKQTTHPNQYYQHEKEKPTHEKHDKTKKVVPKAINIRRAREK